MSNKPLIVVVNRSTVLSDDEVAKAVPAVQTQVSRDFASAWGTDATVEFVPKGKKAPPGAWFLGIFDDADQAGALGYHDLTAAGLPLGKVFARTTIDDGQSWTVCLSHELLEMLGDPNINLCAFDEQNRRLYAYEVCDAVEADQLGYKIGDVLVSDFVLPGWFEPLNISPGERFAFKSEVAAPFDILPGGYIGYFDLGGDGWQQLTAKPSELANAIRMTSRMLGPAPFTARPRVGSRRERRRTPKHQWLRSIGE